MIAILQGRVADLPADVAGIKLLKPILAVSFAITTPVGIGIGLAAFEPGRSEGGECRLLPHFPFIAARTDDLTCFCGICSEGHADPGADVRAIGGNADLRVVRGDARGRLRHGRAPVAQLRAPAGARARELVVGRVRDGCDRVSFFLFAFRAGSAGLRLGGWGSASGFGCQFAFGGGC